MKKIIENKLKKPYEDFNFLEMELNNSNKLVGNLKYYDCELCKNKGYIYIIDNEEIKAMRCSCMTKRIIYRNLENCGIPSSKQAFYIFDNFKVTEDWQKKIKERAEKFVNEFNNDSFCISSISGSGKTMICSIIFLRLIEKGYSGKYFLWKEELRNLLRNKKSYSDIFQEEFSNQMNELKNIDILYIDDLLKLTNERNLNEELEILYEIINARYIKNKCVIISTEVSKEIMEKYDLAIAGRIYEMCKGNWLSLKNDIKRNQRYAK